MKTVKIYKNYKIVAQMEASTLLQAMDIYHKKNSEKSQEGDVLTALSENNVISKGMAFSCVVVDASRLSAVTECLNEHQPSFIDLSKQELLPEKPKRGYKLAFISDHSDQRVFIDCDGNYYLVDWSGDCPYSTDDGPLLWVHELQGRNAKVWSMRRNAFYTVRVGSKTANYLSTIKENINLD